MTTLQPGDRVMYARSFLRSTGQFTGETPFRRGVVTGVTTSSLDRRLVTVRWSDGTISTVLAGNLVRADKLHLEPQ